MPGELEDLARVQIVDEFVSVTHDSLHTYTSKQFHAATASHQNSHCKYMTGLSFVQVVAYDAMMLVLLQFWFVLMLIHDARRILLVGDRR